MQGVWPQKAKKQTNKQTQIPFRKGNCKNYPYSYQKFAKLNHFSLPPSLFSLTPFVYQVMNLPWKYSFKWRYLRTQLIIDPGKIWDIATLPQPCQFRTARSQSQSPKSQSQTTDCSLWHLWCVCVWGGVMKEGNKSQVNGISGSLSHGLAGSGHRASEDLTCPVKELD